MTEADAKHAALAAPAGEQIDAGAVQFGDLGDDGESQSDVYKRQV